MTFTKAGRGEVTSIVVAPFRNTGGDAEDDYLIDGLSAELVSRLMRADGLRVVAPGSAARLKGEGRDARAIGQQLGVGVVLDGSIRKSAGHIWVAAQLIDAGDGRILWAETYDRELKDLAAVAPQISAAALQALKIPTSSLSYKPILQPYTGNQEAYNLYLLGRHYANLQTKEGLRKGLEYFERSVAADPRFAPAYVEVADARSLLAALGFAPPRDQMSKAKEAALRAVEIDSTLAEAHVSLGSTKAILDWDWPGAEAEFRRAMQLNPNHPDTHYTYAMVYLAPRGRLKEALAEVQRAREADALLPAYGLGPAYVHLAMRQADRAIEECRQTLDLYPNFPQAHAILGNAYLQKRMFHEAIQSLQTASRLYSPHVIPVLARAFAQAGQPAEARRILQDLRKQPADAYVSNLDLAVVCSALGERDPALELLEKSCELREIQLIHLRITPQFENLRSEPRFQAILKKMGLGG